MIRKIMLVIVLVFLITGIGFASQDEIAFKNEPDGFRGLKWGDKPTEDMEFLLQNKSEEIFYIRPSDKMKIENVELSSIIYGFYKGRFTWVICNFDKESDYDILEIICKERFGKPIIEEYHNSFWYGNKAMVKLWYYSKAIGGTLTIASRIIKDEKKTTEDGF